MTAGVVESIVNLTRMLSDENFNCLVTFLRDGRFGERPTALQLSAATGISDSVCQALAAVLATPGLTLSQLLFGFEVARQCQTSLSHGFPGADLVWTGPVQFTVPARATLWVMSEMLNSAATSALLVGYNLGKGAAPVIQALASSVTRGVAVRVIGDRLDEQLHHLTAYWPAEVDYPELYTKRPMSEQPFSSLHAKLLVIDRNDALITSANLTSHGLTHNIEIGVRVRGRVAAQIEDLFDELRRSGTLTPIASPEHAT